MLNWSEHANFCQFILKKNQPMADDLEGTKTLGVSGNPGAFSELSITDDIQGYYKNYLKEFIKY